MKSRLKCAVRILWNELLIKFIHSTQSWYQSMKLWKVSSLMTFQTFAFHFSRIQEYTNNNLNTIQKNKRLYHTLLH